MAKQHGGKSHEEGALWSLGEIYASRSALERVTERLFGGSASAVMLELVGRGGLDDDELRRMRDLLDEQLRKAKES